MVRQRKVNNLLALAVLTLASERAMHPYEMAQLLRQRGKDQSIDIKWGSLYTVVQNLERHGLIEAVEIVREGRRPERTVYAVTEAGREEARDWMRELIGTPEKEFTRFEAALSLLPVLPPDEVERLLARRLATLDAELARHQAEMTAAGKQLPRLFLIEGEFALALMRAEADWVRALLAQFRDSSFAGLHAWAELHRTSELPDDVAALMEGGRPPD